MAQDPEDSEYVLTAEQFKDPTTWEKLRTILHTHPNSITRHEACFIVGELYITDLIPDLMQVATKDSSVVARHEAIETLGTMEEPDDMRTIDNFLTGLIVNKNHDLLLDHEDIIATIKIAQKCLARAMNTS